MNSTKKGTIQMNEECFEVYDEVVEYIQNYVNLIKVLSPQKVMEMTDGYVNDASLVDEFLERCASTRLLDEDWFLKLPIIGELCDEDKDIFIIKILGKASNPKRYLVCGIEIEYFVDEFKVGWLTIDEEQERELIMDRLLCRNVAEVVRLIEKKITIPYVPDPLSEYFDDYLEDFECLEDFDYLKGFDCLEDEEDEQNQEI